MEQLPSVRFRSTAFPKYPNENEEIVNEECWGKRLAEFLRDRLPEYGVPTEDILCEDWGWLVYIKNDTFPLWLGCGPMSVMEDEDEAYEENGVPVDENHRTEFLIMIRAEAGLMYRVFKLPFKSWFKEVDTRPAVERVEAGLRQLIATSPEKFQDVIWETIPAK